MSHGTSVRLGVPLLLGLLSASAPVWAQPLTIHDDLGQTIRFDGPPDRIVSLSPAMTEILFAIGLEQRVVGVSDFCNFPAAARDKPRVGGVTANIEAIVALHPDLVVGTGGVSMQEVARHLAQFGIPVVGLESESIEAVFERISLLGHLAGVPGDADGLVARLRAQLHATVSSPRRDATPRVVYLVDEDPYISVGPKSFLHDVLLKAGAFPLPAPADEAYPRITLEAIIAFDPEVIIFASDSDRIPEARIAAWRRWDRLSAVRSGRLYAIPRDLVNRPGPRIVDGVAAIREVIQVGRPSEGMR